MRRWGLVITAFYTTVLLVLLAPAAVVLWGEDWSEAYAVTYGERNLRPWIWSLLLLTGQALLFLPVDRSWRRWQARTRVGVTAVGIGASAALLTAGAAAALLAAVYGDESPAGPGDFVLSEMVIVVVLWAVWGAVFFVHYRHADTSLATALRWLLTGSVLELLVAVPAHVIVRRRGDCCAPGMTAFGIVTGVAIMLMCVGPGVLALYQERRMRYRAMSPGRRSADDPRRQNVSPG
jgi:hypothetical protein